ncbi:MAG TPA: class II aldolase/adducin family protein [Candidatus Binatia bacterium]|nr:class II aldolase/adducin family protein [Candidatus Binatia bacterium]
MNERTTPDNEGRSAITRAEEELQIAAKILEWEIGDIWGHVGVRLPDHRGIAVQMFRRAENTDEDWLVRFDYSLNKLSGVGTIPREAVIYTEIFKARPDVNAAVHCHASMCIALSLAETPIDWVHMQSARFKGGTPIFPRPIYILDESEGADLARSLGTASAIMIKGHGIVTVGASIDEACINAVYMERTAKIMAIARLHGYQSPTPEWIQTLSGSREKLFRRPRDEMFHSAEWNYYADKIKKGERWTRGWT